MKRTWALAIMSVGLIGCGSRELMPYLGRWKAEFIVTQITDPKSDTPKDRQRESLRGYLQLYQTNRTFKMHLEGEQEAIDFNGTWSLGPKDITLLITPPLKIDDEGGKEQRDPNLKFIPPKAINEGYGHSLVARISRDKKTLMGLDMTIGHLIGHHRFQRNND